jgi:hypothetical protein
MASPQQPTPSQEKIMNFVRSFCALSGLIVGLSCVSSASAQWTSNTAANLNIANRGSDQNQPKIKATSDGGCYISWFDGIGSGWDVRLQRLNAKGVEQYPHGGVLVADLTLSSTQDYGLAVDASDNVLLAFQDSRFGSRITAALVTPAGAMPWGVNGVQVSTGGGNAPHCTFGSDGFCVVGWSEGSSTRVQRLDINGAIQWAAGGVAITPATGTYSLSDIQPGESGSAITLFIFQTGFSSPKYLYAQKLSSAGALLWNAGSPVIVFNGTSVQFGYFPTFVPDGSGGAVFGWYETGGNRNGYVQHLNSAGAEVFAHNGVAVSNVTGTQGRLDGSVVYNSATNEIMWFWVETTLNPQNAWGVYGQKVNSAGSVAWAAGGKVLIPVSGLQPAFVRAAGTSDGGAIVGCFDQPGSGAHVMVMKVDASGNLVWAGSPLQACSTTSGKARLDVATNRCGDGLLVWSDSRTDGGDIYAQNVHADAGFGNKRDGDVNGDNTVNIDDLLGIINGWGACNGCAADVAPVTGCSHGNGIVDIDDLLLVINNWG